VGPETKESGNLQQLLRQGLGLQQDGRLEEAKSVYQRILQAEPDHADANHLLGLIAYQGGDPEAAIGLINRAIRSNPRVYGYYSNLALILVEHGRYEEAVACCSTALTIDPSAADAHNNKGNALLALGKVDQAVASFRQAIALQPSYVEAHYNMGNALVEQGMLDAAIDSFDRVLADDPGLPEAHNNKGFALMEQGRLDEAAACFDKALALRPGYAEVHNNKATVMSRQGRVDEAIACADEALALMPDYADAYNTKGIALTDQGRIDDALECFERALKLNPRSADFHNNKGTALIDQGRFGDALESFDRALALKPGYAEPYLYLSHIHTFSDGDRYFAAMEGLWAGGGALSDQQKMYLGFALGKACRDVGRFDEAFDFIEQANRYKRQSYAYDIAEDDEYVKKLIATFDRRVFAARQDAGCADGTPIFIVGMPRSGTSLVEQILASHSHVFGAGERTDLRRIVEGIGGTDFFDRVMDLDAEDLASLGDDYIKRIRAVAGDSRRVTDKMPHNFLYIGIIRLILPGAKVIHCRRDPVDTCWSIFRSYFTGQHKYAYEMTELGTYFRLYQDLMDHWRRELPGFIHDIDYEDLVADQEAETRRLLAFCGLPWEDACLMFHETRRAVQTASAGQVRKPIYRDSVRAWKHHERQLEPLRRALSGS
jgi:tetratricopeptide (TPR) repeat protein